jgi:hypothetical protein
MFEVVSCARATLLPWATRCWTRDTTCDIYLYHESLILYILYCPQRRALPAVPTSNDLTFVPLQTDRSMEAQLAVVDIVLHKATDEIVSVDISRQTSDPADRIQYSDSIQRLQRCLTQNSQIVMIFSRIKNSLKFFCQQRQD